MTVADISGVTAELAGVAQRRRNGLLEWRYRGRLVARQLDHGHVVIRTSFDFRDFLLHSFPDTFAVPSRFRKHMMIVADLQTSDRDAIEDAIIGAWELQSIGPNLQAPPVSSAAGDRGTPHLPAPGQEESGRRRRRW
jgi:hypothetical protein